MAAAEVRGVQSQGVGVSVKHFALNNAENYRFLGNSVADMRAIRELYLKVFEHIVKEAEPATMMCAYNQINCAYCAENKWLLTDVLRKEWGFDGLVMTDWGAMKDRVASLKAGLDLEMPGDTAICRKWIMDAIGDGTLSMTTLDAAVEHVLKLVERYAVQKGDVDFEAHHELAAEIAADCAVLMKNDGTLPLKHQGKFLVVGDLFKKMRYQGAGSSMIHATKVTTPQNAFDESGISYEYVLGYRENCVEAETDLIAEAVQKANLYDTILVFAGLTDYVESEGCDREYMGLPENQLALLEALSKTGKRIVVILFGGGVVELPFAQHVNAILNLFLPGQNGGTAAKQLLFGEKNPSGRLAESWPVAYRDVPFGERFSKELREVYNESIYVGYRYYLTANQEVRYPFGYGLSYTTFAYENPAIFRVGDKVVISLDVINTGSMDGAEVVQLYVKAPRSAVFKPEKELRAFEKVYLRSGERKKVTLEVSTADLCYFHIPENRWVLESGIYEFQLCRNCEAVVWAAEAEIKGEDAEVPYTGEAIQAYEHADVSKMTDEAFEVMSGMKIPEVPAKFPVTLNSRFTDLKQTFMGRVLYNAVLSSANGQRRKAEKMPEGAQRDNCVKGAQFMKRVMESNSLNSMTMSAGRSYPYNFAQGFVALANGHLFKGILHFCTPVKAPKLPKEQKRNRTTDNQ